jgi:hypothetical protein
MIIWFVPNRPTTKLACYSYQCSAQRCSFHLATHHSPDNVLLYICVSVST